VSDTSGRNGSHCACPSGRKDANACGAISNITAAQ
jgi:hypothetical protein